MNVNRKKQVGLLLIVVVIAGLFAVMAGGVAAKGGEPPVLPPQSNAFGRTYEEWAVEWWKSMFALPADENHPMLAEGVVDCSYGQDGKVWFLAGAPFQFAVGEDTVERTCVEPIPTGKALFFPVMNVICNTYDGDDIVFGSLANCANIVTDNFLIPLSATVDGVEIEDLEAYRTISQEFTIETSDPPLFGYSPSGGTGVTGGYYLLLPPLSRGEHDILFSGKVYVPDPEYPVDWTINVSYELTVAGDD